MENFFIATWINRAAQGLGTRHQKLAAIVKDYSYGKAMMANGREVLISTAPGIAIAAFEVLLAIGNVASSALLGVVALFAKIGDAKMAGPLKDRAIDNFAHGWLNVYSAIGLTVSCIINIVATIIPRVMNPVQIFCHGGNK